MPIDATAVGPRSSIPATARTTPTSRGHEKPASDSVLVADYRFARHVVSDEGMDFGRPTGRRLFFRWEEVRAVRFGNLGHWFKIELQSGEVLRVPVAMAGLPAFADQALRKVPAARIERDTLRMLERTARGDLPPLR